MSLSDYVGNYRFAAVTAFALLFAALSVGAQERFVVGVIGDGAEDRMVGQHQKFVEELGTLTASEFDVQIRYFNGNWSKESISDAIEHAYADPDVDMVLATGLVANQVAAIRREFPKPTFLPIILDVALVVGAAVDGKSGIRNLNYLSAYADFAIDLDTFARIAPYQKLALLLDASLLSAIPELSAAAYAVADARGVELVAVPHDGVDHRLLNKVTAGTDGIIIAGLPRMPEADFALLIEAINAAGLPSYSFVGVSDVEAGLLVTNSEPRDIDRQARLNALNMQAVMLGERTEDQPTRSRITEQLTINMATARRLGLSLSFDILGEAVLLNRDEEVGGEQLGLVEITRMALAQNQDLLAEGFGVQAGLEEIARARANLLPQVGASASHTLRKDTSFVTAGVYAERSTDAALSVDQLLYSDAASANLKIQKELQNARLASLQQFELDVIQAATTTYYTVLNARSQLAVQDNNLTITKANLELAEDRVRLGTSTPADVYRWQAEVARAQIRVLNARSALDQSWDTLNRILHLPQGVQLSLKEASFDGPFVMTQDEFDKLVRSPADYARFSRFYIDRGIGKSPELQQLDAQIAAQKRDLTSQRRAYWLPDFTVGGRYTSNLGQSGVGAGPGAGQDLNDWSVGVQATLPIFSGGLKKANVSRSSYELRQLEYLRASSLERVEEAIRSQLHAAQAAYGQIELSAVAATASRKNYELVSDAYARGTVTVIELLDAQETSIAASAAEAESLHNFLTTVMALQRAVGGFDYLLPIEERNALAAQMRLTMTGSEQ